MVVPFSQRFFAMLRLRDNLAFATLAVVVAVVGVVVVAVVDAWFDMDVDHHHITEL